MNGFLRLGWIGVLIAVTASCTSTDPRRLPDTSAPDGSVPDSSVPDGSAPDGSAPDGSAPDGSAPDGSAPDADTGGIRILDATVSAPRLTEGEMVGFNAVVTHTGGIDRLLGGTVATIGGTTLGSMTAEAPGTYSLTVSWDDIHAAEAIEFDAPVTRSFVMKFFDIAGAMAETRVSLELHCAGGAACEGSCTDLDSDPDNCGSCRRSCDLGGTSVTGCTMGSCVLVAGTGSRVSCATACGRLGHSCSNLCEFTTLCSGGCSGPTLSSYRDRDNFNTHRPGDEAGFFSYHALLSSSGNNWLTRDTMSCSDVPASAISFYDYDVSLCCCEVDVDRTAPQVISVDLPVVPHGLALELRGSLFTGATAVTVGGVSQAFAVDSDTQITIDTVTDAVPIGTQDVIVTTPAGTSAPYSITVLHLLISEVDSDNFDIDEEEFVEIDTGVAGVSLRDYVLVLYNGNSGVADEAFRLSGTTDAVGRLVIGNAAVAEADIVFRNSAIQNGADAFAIYRGAEADFPDGTPIRGDAIDAVVWDTDDADATALLSGLLGAGPEAVQINENANGARFTDSVQRCGTARLDGRGWTTAPRTPGAPNACP